MEKLTRKEFLQQAASAGLAASALGRLGLTPAAGAEGVTVALVTSPLAIKEGVPAAEVVTAMVNKAVATLTGKPVLAAWKSIFKPTDVVGIKVNCIAGPRMSTRPAVAMAVAQGAVTAGVKPEKVIIYERTAGELMNVGFTINKDGPGTRCVGIAPDGWAAEETAFGRFRGPLAKLVAEQITALANVPVLKDHDSAGVTFALKNHFGSIQNPGAQHHDFHGTIADLNAVPAIRQKARLVIGDCLLALPDGGPAVRGSDVIWEAKAVLAAFDPVAADFVAWQMLDEQRRTMGLKSLAEVGREPRFIANAAAAGLGTNDPAKIRTVKVTV